MAVTISQYDHTEKKLLNKEVTYTTLKVELLNDSATFAAANTTRNQVNNTGAYAVSGNGWTAGGMTIANVAVTTVSTKNAKLTGDNISVTATGGSIGPAYKAVIYDDTDGSDAPLWFVDFGGLQEAGVGTDFKVNWHANGIHVITAP